MSFLSCAQWPKGTFDSQNNYTEDTHGNQAQALAVTYGLHRRGAGGDGKEFPEATWVEPVLYVPPDGDEAYSKWKASCGPNALAALLKCPVDSLHPFFQKVNFRGWTNLTQMKAVLAGLGVAVTSINQEWPANGLVLVQFTGPWDAPNVPVAAALKHTHWITVKGTDVYDPINQEWSDESAWSHATSDWCKKEIKKCTGWRVRYAVNTVLLPLRSRLLLVGGWQGLDTPPESYVRESNLTEMILNTSHAPKDPARPWEWHIEGSAPSCFTTLVAALLAANGRAAK